MGVFFRVGFRLVFGGSWRGLLASVESFGGPLGVLWYSIWNHFSHFLGIGWIFENVCFTDKTILFEVWDGPGSLLFRVMLFGRYFGSIRCGISGICWPLGSP